MRTHIVGCCFTDDQRHRGHDVADDYNHDHDVADDHNHEHNFADDHKHGHDVADAHGVLLMIITMIMMLLMIITMIMMLCSPPTPTFSWQLAIADGENSSLVRGLAPNLKIIRLLTVGFICRPAKSVAVYVETGAHNHHHHEGSSN